MVQAFYSLVEHRCVAIRSSAEYALSKKISGIIHLYVLKFIEYGLLSFVTNHTAKSSD